MDTALHMCLTRAEQRGRIASLDLLEMLFLMQTRMLLACFAATVYCWLMDNLGLWTPRPFSTKLFCSYLAPSLCWCMGLFLPSGDLGISL